MAPESVAEWIWIREWDNSFSSQVVSDVIRGSAQLHDELPRQPVVTPRQPHLARKAPPRSEKPTGEKRVKISIVFVVEKATYKCHFFI